MTAIPDLTTPRLILRPIVLADAEAIQRLFPRIEVVRFLSSRVPWPYPADGALSFIRDVVLPGMQGGTQWHWSIRPRSAPEQLIGSINLRESPDENRGFWLDPAWQRRGLMTEASDAVTDYWFGPLQRPVLRVAKAIDNNASRRISEVAGMRIIVTEQRDYVTGRLPSEIWEMTSEEWHARRAAAPRSI